MQKILFTGSGGAATELIWRILNKKYDLYFADMEISTISSTIPFEKKIKIPEAKDKNFITSLISITRNLGISYIVPGVDEELPLIAKEREKFPCLVYLPSETFINLTNNKLKFSRSIELNGFFSLNTEKVSKKIYKNFPKVIKPIYGRGSRGFMVVKNNRQINAYKEVYPEYKNNLLIQQYFEGDEYTVFVSSNVNGKLNCIIPVKVNIKRGITINAHIDHNEHIIKQIKIFHNKYKTFGPYNVQCFINERNEVAIFEVNPRVSTTFCLILALGFDPFEIYNIDAEIYKIDKKLELKRYWFNDVNEI